MAASRPRATLHRSSTVDDSPVDRTRRAWSNNGVHYTMETTSFNSPGFSFSTMSGGGRPLRRTFTAPQPHTRSGIGASFLPGGIGHLLGDLLSLSQQPPSAHHLAQTSRRSQGEPTITLSDAEDGDDDLAYPDEDSDGGDGPNHRPSLMSRLRGKFVPDTSQEPSRQPDSNREASPKRRPRPDRKSSSYRSEEGKPSSSQHRQRRSSKYNDGSDDKEEASFEQSRHRHRHRFNADQSEDLQTPSRHSLEIAADSERRAIKTAKRRLEQASRQPTVPTNYLEDLVTDIKRHERSLRAVEKQLDAAKAAQQDREAERRASSFSAQPGPSRRRKTSRAPDESFVNSTSRGRHQQSHPLFGAFDNFESWTPFTSHGAFGDLQNLMDAMDNDMGTTFGFPPTGGTIPDPQPKRTRYTSAGGPHYRRNPTSTGSTHPMPKRQIQPSNLLTIQEAQRLFETYNERWTALVAHDSNVPYPGRGLRAQSLSARETVWAPRVSTSVSEWSEEEIMQANAQAFFLGVVGLAPLYTEAPATRRVEMGFDRTGAQPMQVKRLIDLLKKEKTRWHSDRLGRRNGGKAGLNETLQKDERARAVFHAVCELMTFAQGE